MVGQVNDVRSDESLQSTSKDVITHMRCSDAYAMLHLIIGMKVGEDGKARKDRRFCLPNSSSLSGVLAVYAARKTSLLRRDFS